MTRLKARIALTAAAVRDMLMVMTGYLVASSTPPSLNQFDGGRLGAFVWSLMLLLGGLISLGGLLRGWRAWEAAGCSMVGVGFLIWGTAAICQDDRTSVSVAVACVFYAGFVGQVYRVVMVGSRALPTLAPAAVGGNEGDGR